MTTAIAQALSSALLHFVWQGLIAALLLRMALFALRNRSANSRYVASCAALLLVLAMPVVTACILYRAPSAMEPVAAAAPAPPPTGILPGTAAASWQWIAGWQSWILPAWSIGVLLFSLRLIWACRQVSFLRRSGTAPDNAVLALVARLEARLDLTRRVRVLVTPAADGPSVVGWIRPVILMPSATLLGLTTEQLEAVLAHELAHVRRHDYLVNLVQTVVESLLFYHPAVWWISARIRHERELCCDDLAVSSCGDALCYARALTRLEKLRATPALAMAGTGGPLLYRIQRLVGARPSEYAPSRLSGILAIALGITCFAINIHWARGQSHRATSDGQYVFVNLARTPYQDGSGVTVNLNGAAIVHRSSLEYPHTAVEKSIQGTVTVEAVLEDDGTVADARVLNGPSELRRDVLQSVLEWHFAPAPAGTSRQVTVNFDLPTFRKHEAEVQTEAGNIAVTELRGEPGNLQASDGNLRTVVDREQFERLKRQLQELEQHQGLQNEASNEALNSLKSQLEEARAKLEMDLQVLHAERHPGQEEIARLERQLQEQMQNQEPNESTLNSLQSQLEEAPTKAIGHRLAKIDIVAFPGEVRQTLTSRLGVQIGDTITEASLGRIIQAVTPFEPHDDFTPEWRLVPLDSNDYALLIIAPKPQAEVRTFHLRK